MIYDGMTARELIEFKRQYGVSTTADRVVGDRPAWEHDPDDDKDWSTLYGELMTACAEQEIFAGMFVDPLFAALGFEVDEDSDCDRR